jgi:hypothetical protein
MGFVDRCRAPLTGDAKASDAATVTAILGHAGDNRRFRTDLVSAIATRDFRSVARLLDDQDGASPPPPATRLVPNEDEGINGGDAQPAAESPRQGSQARLCEVCGSELIPEAKFCEGCGRALADAPGAEQAGVGVAAAAAAPVTTTTAPASRAPGTNSDPGGSFKVFAIRTAQDVDGRLYPVLGDQGAEYPMELEELDGSVQRVKLSGLGLSEYHSKGLKTILTLKDVPVELFITEARVVIACEQWNRGSRYWGIGLGATTALVHNTVNRVREARQRRGALMLGQIRYAWITEVGFRPGQVLTYGQLRLGVAHSVATDNTLRRLYVDVGTKRADSESLARSIVRGASRYWLMRESIDDDAARRAFEHLALGPILPPPGPKRLAMYSFPIFRPASAATALPRKVSESNG